MADVTHGWAFLNGIPVTNSKVTLDSEGAAIGSGCRIIGPLSYKPSYRNSNEDVSEVGVLTGERHFDLVETLSFSIAVPSNFSDIARLTKGAIVTLASVTPTSYNGVWQIDDVEHSWQNDDRTVFPLTLRRNAGFTPTAQNPS